MVRLSYMGRGDSDAVRVAMEINAEGIEESNTEEVMDKQNRE